MTSEIARCFLHSGSDVYDTCPAYIDIDTRRW